METRTSRIPSHPLEKAQVWILSRTPEREWRVLLLKTLPERGAFWQPVTGKVENEETIPQGALREAIEETGLAPLRALKSLDLDFYFEGKWGPCHETVFYYETYSGCPKATLDRREHQEYQWMTIEQASAHLRYEPNRQALMHLARRIQKSGIGRGIV